MYKTIKNIFNFDELAKLADFVEINNKTTKIDFSYLRKISKFLQKQDKLNKLIQFFEKGLNSPQWIQKIKYHITFHHILNTHKSKKLTQMYMQSTNDIDQSIQKTKGIQDIEVWMMVNIVDHYHQYLQKYCSSVDLYLECMNTKMISLEDLKEINTIHKCFKILNIINFILKIQISLNKVGRYYKQYKQIMLDLYSMYLTDLRVYYDYLKKTIECIFKEYKKLSKQQLRHSFIFFNQVQKTTDHLYQFFFIRYYHHQIRVGVTFPKFLKIDHKKYKQLIKFVKKSDPSIEITHLHNHDQPQLNKTQIVESIKIPICSQNNKTFVDQNPELNITFSQKFKDLSD